AQRNVELAVASAIEPTDGARVPTARKLFIVCNPLDCGLSRDAADGWRRMKALDQVDDMSRSAKLCLHGGAQMKHVSQRAKLWFPRVVDLRAQGGKRLQNRFQNRRVLTAFFASLRGEMRLQRHLRRRGGMAEGTGQSFRF